MTRDLARGEVFLDCGGGAGHPARMFPAKLSVLLAASAIALGGCATTSGEGGRSRFVAPRQLAEAYSEVELRTLLAVTPDAPCSDTDCEAHTVFRHQTKRIGTRLSTAAREIREELKGPQPGFIFLVPQKSEFGTLSSASGSIIVFDGLRTLELEEPALAFLIAREMGHVISRHHDENSATSIAVSVAVALVMPMAAVLRGAAATLSTLTSGSVAATAATTAASVAGARAVKSIYRPEQLREADLAALKILNQAGWPTPDVAESLLRASNRLGDEGWMGELQTSVSLIKEISGITELAYVPPSVAEAGPLAAELPVEDALSMLEPPPASSETSETSEPQALQAR